MVTPNKRTLKFRDDNKIVEGGKVDSGQGLLKYSLSQWSSLPEAFTNSPRVDGPSMYSLLTFESLLACLLVY